ncbi:hypothetical protein [Cupriavidus campinensis]|uniref:Uncharacterized protein n=1 Tax=Cupriavidus campinensis TaxID=151783 RepID=A0ABY3EJ69_9BURK|nr:hypothetical protein [Cupriavidus campinensis]TSP10975.1 hypothetical protein FGG12_19115 [Cupriavidus campinensis]
MQDVEGMFVPEDRREEQARVFGKFQTHDACVNICFDPGRVALPTGPGVIRASGKLWIGERTSTLTLLVTKYQYVDAPLQRRDPGPTTCAH